MPLCCLSARKPGNHSSLDTDWFSSLWRAPCPQPSRAYLWLVPCCAHWGGLWIVLEENLWEAFGRFVFEGWTTSGVCQHSRQCLWAAKIPVRALLPQHPTADGESWLTCGLSLSKRSLSCGGLLTPGLSTLILSPCLHPSACGTWAGSSPPCSWKEGWSSSQTSSGTLLH